MTRVVLIPILFLLQLLGTTLAQKTDTTIFYVKAETEMDGTKYDKNKLNITDDMEFTFNNVPNIIISDSTLTQNGENITMGDDLEKFTAKLETNKDTNSLTLTIKKTPARAGPYELKLAKKDGGQETKKFTVFSAPYVEKFSKSKRVLEGDPLTIQCVVYGWPTPVIAWSRDLVGTEEVSKGPGFNVPWNVTANKTVLAGDTLAFDSMKFSDSGLYQCNATNEYGSDVSVIKVRVKDRLAALWPFIGIIIEVVILVAVILVYEKRRANSKKNMAEEDRQPMSDTKEKDANDKGDDVRQRNVKA